jgi:hypothetical protein
MIIKSEYLAYLAHKAASFCYQESVNVAGSMQEGYSVTVEVTHREEGTKLYYGLSFTRHELARQIDFHYINERFDCLAERIHNDLINGKD